jgi:O-antigen ligase
MKKNIHNLIYPILLFAGFSIALPPFFKSLSLVLLLLVLLLNRVVNKNQTYFSKILNFKNPVLYLAVFYFLYCIGMFYTTDLKEGFRDLNIKLPLILLPIVACLLPKRIITKKRLWNLFLAFALGLIVLQVYLLVIAFSNAFSTDVFDVKQLFYTKLAGKYHSTYLSLFTSFALVYSYLLPFKYIAKSTKKAFTIKFVFILWLSIYNVLLSSRIGIIAMFLAFVVIMFNELVIKRRLLNTLTYLFVCIVFVLSSFAVNNINKRFDNMAAKTQIEENKDKKLNDGVSQRSFIYKNAGELIERNLVFGAGTGDVRATVQEFYLEKGVNFKTYLNPHNQFIQTAVAIGVVGLIFFIVMLLSFSLSFWNKNGLLFLFSIGMLCVYMMTESIIERQQGVHFVAFYLMWLSAFKGMKKEM